MNTIVQYSSLTFSDNEHNRDQCLDYLSSKKFPRVIDVGASAYFWAPEYVTHCFDIIESTSTKDKTSFAICTHTLEDICNPGLVCKMLSRISEKGFIAVPSKYYELTRHEGQYRGWQHHRWIFNKEGSNIVAYPKLAFVDYIPELDSLAKNLNPQVNGELQWYWQHDINLTFINNDYLGPSPSHVYGYYAGLLDK